MAQNKPLSSIKTGAFSRRMSIAKAGLVAGTRLAGSAAIGWLDYSDNATQHKSDALRKQADYLVNEIGKLKGSVVKIGQMMALYGEHFLPAEVTEALHTLNDNSTPLAWDVLYKQLQQNLGEGLLSQLTINPVSIGAASLAQVHQATINATGEQVVLKIQYPGVAAAIDSDLKLFKQLMHMARLMPQTAALEEWFEEIRAMLHSEVDYTLEAATITRFESYLADDPDYVVPKLYPQWCSHNVLCMRYEQGVPLNDAKVLSLSQARRNQLGELVLGVAMREICQWGEMQTDPNFGNYLVRIDPNGVHDKLVLLDFGAVRQFDANLLQLAKNLLAAGHSQRIDLMTAAMTNYPFFDEMPVQVKQQMAKVFLQACVPFASSTTVLDGESLHDADGAFMWYQSDLHARVMRQLGESMASRYFALPPKEVMFLSRKFIGVYTCLTVLHAHTHSYAMATTYLR